MSSNRKGELNPLYGKSHSEETKELMRQKTLGRKHSEETKLLMSSKMVILLKYMKNVIQKGLN